MCRLQTAERAAVSVEASKNPFFPIMLRVLRPGSLCMSMPRSKGLPCHSRLVDERMSSSSDLGSSKRNLSRIHRLTWRIRSEYKPSFFLPSRQGFEESDGRYKSKSQRHKSQAIPPQMSLAKSSSRMKVPIISSILRIFNSSGHAGPVMISIVNAAVIAEAAAMCSFVNSFHGDWDNIHYRLHQYGDTR
jgi:hypothetical protein